MLSNTLMRFIILFLAPIMCFSQLTIASLNLTKEIEETSGLEIYGNDFITHNDSGDKAKVYIFNSKGEMIRSVRFYDLTSKDWEDIAADATHYYIADTGNNLGNRKALKIYILSSALDPEGTIHVNYKAQENFADRNIHPYDAEALTVYGDSLLLFSKNRKTQQSEIYSFPKTAGDYTLSPIAVLDVGSLITAADYNQELDLLALTGYNFKWEQFFYTVTDFKKNGWDSFTLSKHKIPVGRAQIEAVKIMSAQDFMLTSEKVKNEPARLIHLTLEN